MFVPARNQCTSCRIYFVLYKHRTRTRTVSVHKITRLMCQTIELFPHFAGFRLAWEAGQQETVGI